MPRQYQDPALTAELLVKGGSAFYAKEVVKRQIETGPKVNREYWKDVLKILETSYEITPPEGSGIYEKVLDSGSDPTPT